MVELKTVETVDTSPFKKLVVTIGELPTSFVESMTYYELLAWFTNYLQNTIIPAVNNNGEAVIELQEKFVELKTFVDTYFDNLDVQEEINNKLDEMADDGTLATIVSEYLNSVALFTYDNVATMKLATNFVNGSFAKTLGYTVKDDLGGTIYKIRTKSVSDTIDEQTVLSLYDETLVAELVPATIMNSKQFGILGNDTDDETTKIQNMISYAGSKDIKELIFDEGSFLVSDTINIPSNLTISGNGKGATVIKLTPDTSTNTNYFIFDASTKTNIKINGITFQGSKGDSDYSISEDKLYFGVRFYNSSYCIVKECEFKQFHASALAIRRSSHITVEDNVFSSNAWNDIALTLQTDDIKINNNTFADIAHRGINGEDGLITEKVTNVIITNNVMNSNNPATASRAISFSNSSLSGSGYRYERILISNNTFNNTWEGILFKFAKDITIVNNIASVGRFLANVGTNMTDYNLNIIIENNTINCYHSNGTDTNGCSLTRCKDIKFINNVISNSHQTALTLTTSYGVIIENNTIKDSGNHGIRMTGEDCSILNNTIVNTTGNAISTDANNVTIKANTINTTGSDGVSLGGSKSYYWVEDNIVMNATRYGILFPSGSSGDKFAVLRNNKFGEDREVPVFTYAYIANVNVDYVVIENTYLLTTGVTLRGSSHWGTNCAFRNNEGFGTLPA